MANGGRARLVLVLVIALLAGACRGGSDAADSGAAGEPGPTAASAAPEATSQTSAVEPTVAPTAATASEPAVSAPDPSDPSFVEATVSLASVSEGTFMIAIVDAAGTAIEGSLGGDADGTTPTAADPFRVGSITKVFTSLVTLSLVDDGLVDLDAPAADYLTRVPVPDGVSVRHLLSHRSGIFNYTEEPAFFESVVADPSRVWTPEETAAFIVDQASLFDPGTQFRYSNTNYLILGVLIEEVTGQPYHQILRERLLDPLDMTSTYLAGFESGAEPFDPYVEPGGDDDYTSIATAAWSAGAVVSSAVDLHALFTGLFDGSILSQALVREMTDGGQYGLGVELADWRRGLVGHSGSIPGYGTLVRHSPESRLTAFFVSTEDEADPSNSRQAVETIVEAMASDAGDDSLSNSAAEPPANDLFESAVSIDPGALPFRASVDTTGATADADDRNVGCPAPATDASVWYSITPTTDVQLLVGASDSDYSVGISVATADAGSLLLIECRPFPFTVEAQANTTYHFQVFDGQEDGGGNGGNLELIVEQAESG